MDLITSYNAQKLSNRRGLVWIFKFVAAVAALTVMPMRASAQIDAEASRIQITLLKARHGGSSGVLFYEGQKYGLGISGTKLSGIWITRIDLIGTALNLRRAADIIGAYTAADVGSAIVGQAKMARLENSKGIILEIRGVSLKRSFSLDLTGMTIKTLSWQASAE